jgi:hypothetical protein
MTGLLQRNHWHRGLFAALLALALGLRILIPAGFMPLVSADGVSVTLCSGTDAGNVTVDLGKKPVDRPQDAGPCSFGAGLAAGLLPVAAVLLLLPLPEPPALPQLPLRAQRLAPQPAAPPPPAIGPPAIG